MLDRPKILTILIPTYNGEKTIERALRSVVSQIESDCLQDKVNILIADNCSSDSSIEIIEQFAATGKFFQVIRAKTNGGLDSNLRTAMGAVSTPYVKILSDDDTLLNGYIKHLISIIDINKDVDLIVSSMVILTGQIADSTPKPPSESLLFETDPKFIEYSNGAFGQLSTLCFRTESWFESDHSPILADYAHHNMEFVGRVYHLAIYGICLFDDSKLMENDLGPKRWHTSYLDLFKVNCSHASFIFEMGLLNLDNHVKRDAWRTWIARTNNSMMRQLVLDLMGLKKDGVSVLEEQVSFFTPRGAKKRRSLFFAVHSINLLPSWVSAYTVRVIFRTRSYLSRTRYFRRS